MRWNVAIIFLLISPHTYSKECILTPKIEAELIRSSQYHVKNIQCVSGQYKWLINNEIYFTDKLLLSDLENEIRIKGNNGEILWLISNKKYLISNDQQVKSSRVIASIDSNKLAEADLSAKAEDILPKSTNNSIHALSFALNSQVTSISSKDTSSSQTEKAVSNLGVGFNLVWTHLWSENLSFYATGSIKQFKFKVSEGRGLEESNINQSSVGAGLNFKIGSSSLIGLELGQGDSFILSSDGTDTLEIQKASLTSAILKGDFSILEFKSGYRFRLNTQVGVLLGSSQNGYTTEQGSYYSVGLGSYYNLSGRELFIKTSISQSELEAVSAKQTSKELGITAGIGWAF